MLCCFLQMGCERLTSEGAIGAIYDRTAKWRERLLLFKLDRQKLGRMRLNHLRNTRRRSWVSQRSFRYDTHFAEGAVIVSVFETTQNVVDEFAGTLRVRECLVPIDVQHLLPPEGSRGFSL
jgi:hypothetical protein